jgi:hypothetical protein
MYRYSLGSSVSWLGSPGAGSVHLLFWTQPAERRSNVQVQVALSPGQVLLAQALFTCSSGHNLQGGGVMYRYRWLCLLAQALFTCSVGPNLQRGGVMYRYR